MQIGIGLGLGMATAPRNPYGTDFVMEVETTASDESFTIVCLNSGTFDATVDWGDDNTSAITAFNDADLTHTYADAGLHIIRVSGTLPNVFFGAGANAAKVRRVLQLGAVGWAGNPRWDGCSGLTSFTVGSTAVTGGITSFAFSFRNCTSLASMDWTGFDASGLTDINNMLRGCIALTTIDLSMWNVDSSLKNMNSAFFGCTSINTINITGWDTSGVTNMTWLFRSNGALDVIGLESLNIEAVTSLSLFLENATLPTSRYDAVLEAWAAQNVVDSLAVDFGGSKYTAGSAAATARADLISTDSWTITDGGTA